MLRSVKGEYANMKIKYNCEEIDINIERLEAWELLNIELFLSQRKSEIWEMFLEEADLDKRGQMLDEMQGHLECLTAIKNFVEGRKLNGNNRLDAMP